MSGQRFFAYRGTKLWNSLNNNIKSLKCPNNLSRHFANVLLSLFSIFVMFLIYCNYNIIVLIFLIDLNSNLYL